ncbi:Flp family type IVb pilin [Henriciella barbarensis]|jgi:pilus assembly protein Flp/PilA|uniref:Flp family type IVb pilin n=2 Tax=Henriciella TaxID=453849 RepID=A0A399QZ99_9PROT|nr:MULTISPECIES: Flp family type IVb pilin [Henriciella]MCH2457474.1 Flp family type IVb pilin [Henriciella sp.]MCZ4296902.1 Flp family type IVb pilin [Henriciella marina]RIJ24198.1 Flp family type IVb pilin [Henriciella barbarensis]
MFIKPVKKLKSDESGASAVEYGLIMGLMTILLITALTTVGSKTSDHFNEVESGFSG